MAEYRQGQGPGRLPQGAAQALNEAAAPPAEDVAGSPVEGGDIPVLYAPGEDDPIPDDDSGLSEEMGVLLAPPHPNYQPPLMAQNRARVPRYVVRNLPILMAAARDPEAPPTIRALYNATVRRLEEEMREGRA